MPLENEGSEDRDKQALPFGHESGQGGGMDVRACLSAAKEVLWGQWWFRIALAIWFLVSGYDTFSGAFSQIIPGYELVTLGSLVMGGSHVLPWWGWLLILQGLLWAALAEYVARHIPSLRAASAEPERKIAPAAAVVAAPAPEPTRMLMTNPAPTPAPDYPGKGLMTAPRKSAPATPADLVKAMAAGAATTRAAAMRRWTKVGSFEVWEAASLWANEPPPVSSLHPTSESSRANLAMLKAAILDGELVAVPASGLDSFIGRGVSDNSRVTRENLIAYARAKGELPPFLFPPA